METIFLTALSDTDLLAHVQRLVHAECRTTAVLVAHLAEIENRKLYLREGCASMFVYCTRVLHLSEHAAYHRIAAARLARRFPAVLVGLERGDVHVTALEMLAGHFTAENHQELLAAAKHKSKREILELIAHVQPKPDVAAAVRKLPVKPTRIPGPPAPARTSAGGDAEAIRGVGAVVDAGSVGGAVGGAGAVGDAGGMGAAAFALTPPSGLRRAEVVPLAPERYKIQFTASADTCNKLRRAQELLRHRIPNGDVAAVVDQALDLLVRDLERQKFAATNRPRRAAASEQRPNAPGTSEPQSDSSPSTPAATGPRTGAAVARENSEAAVQSAGSRHIPAEVKRIVWQRDHGRCTFTSPDGTRCGERGRLEFDHIRPYGDGGNATAANVRLLCRAHNQYEAEQFFGVWEASTG